MEYKRIKKSFKVVGIKGSGAFDNLGEEIPILARQLLSRSDEIENHLGVEIALFEPKLNSSHQVGNYIVGLLVADNFTEVPEGMDFVEIDQLYVNARGEISDVGTLHSNLLKWTEEQGYIRNLASYIVETYHLMEDGEEVEIFLPIY